MGGIPRRVVDAPRRGPIIWTLHGGRREPVGHNDRRAFVLSRRSSHAMTVDMVKAIPLIPGARYGRFTILSEAAPKFWVNGRGRSIPIRAVLCRCDCGQEREVAFNSLRSGNTKACGCLARDRAKTGEIRRIDGRTADPIYWRWMGMVQRCRPDFKQAKDYHGRGIAVCSEWLDPIEGWKLFAAEIGPMPSPAHTVERIDNDDGYRPGNVRWATRKEQAANRRVSQPRKVTTES